MIYLALFPKQRDLKSEHGRLDSVQVRWHFDRSLKCCNCSEGATRTLVLYHHLEAFIVVVVCGQLCELKE
jgi:hypothetical protein